MDEVNEKLFKNTIGDFITGFQFLTRIHIVTQTEWSMDSFARSVKFFPIIGAIIGLILAGIICGVKNFCGERVPLHVLAILIIIAEIMITGGLHCDGFMDTIDGVFSGRSRERKLEIMKDSRVGAFGVMSFCLLALIKYSLFVDMESTRLPIAVLAMPIVGRMGLVLAVTLYPYARADGMGKIFYLCDHRKTLCVAGMLSMLMLTLLGKMALINGVVGSVAAVAFSTYISKQLNGLTGDVYGAVTEFTEMVTLLIFIF